MRYLLIPVLAFGLAPIAAASSARAEMLPSYDPQVLCSDLAGTSIRQDMIMRGCLDFQERMRKEVSLSWDKLPAAVQTSCVKSAGGTGDYWRLKSCIDKETEIAAH